MSTALAQLKACRDALAAWREGRLPMTTFCQQARAAQDCLNALPARYAEVWHNLLDRLESSALFAEESCSFSQTDLGSSGFGTGLAYGNQDYGAFI